ncbi:MAG: lysophospholipid acyltransferase family protein, partial [Gemmatimonadota bacterium]|nr:lysophospholipid acyltransferase family protein [Gemmatimonadota bacterium]
AEYFALRGALAVMGRLGLVRAGAVGARLGTFGYRPLGIRRAVVERQLAVAFPELDRAAIERTARAAYAHLGRVAVEAALLPYHGRVLDLFDEADNWEAVERAREGGSGILFVTGHLGNWELAGAYVAGRGIPVDAIARNQANPLFDRYLTRTRERIGMRIVPDERAVAQVPRAIRAGRAVAMLTDQETVGLASTWVPFFGRPAKTPRGPAVFALRLNAPLIFGCALRQPGGRYRMSFEEIPVERTSDLDADVDRIVAAYTATLERWVRRAPAQYFWHHRRWKYPPPAPAEGTT